MRLTSFRCYKLVLGLIFIFSSVVRPVQGFEMNDLIKSFCIESLNSKLETAKQNMPEEKKINVCECFLTQVKKSISIDKAKSICIRKVIKEK